MLVFVFQSEIWIAQNFNFTVFDDFCLSLSQKYPFSQNVNHAKVQSKTNKYCNFHVDLTRRRRSKSRLKKWGMVPKKMDWNSLSLTFTANAKGKNITWSRVSRNFSRLPFSTWRGLFSRWSTTGFNASISLKFLIHSATIISLCLILVMSYLFFYSNWPFFGSVYTKGKKKCEKASWCLVVTFGKTINCFMKKALKSCSTSKHPKETTFNR